jgi:hypothetical protein
MDKLSRKRITIAVATVWGLVWFSVVAIPNAIHYVRVWRNDGIWCAAYQENGKVRVYWYGKECDPEWAKQQPGQ